MDLKRIAIHSVPRSGSSWLGEIFDSNEHVAYRFQPLFSYSHKDQLDKSSTKEEIDRFFLDIYNTTDEFVLQTSETRAHLKPEFIKNKITHLVYKEVRYHHIIENLLNKDSNIKIIGLVRSPLSVINSWLKAPKEFRKDLGWKIKNEWRFASKKNQKKKEKFYGYEKWKEVTVLFERLYNIYPNNFYLINYSELLINTEKTAEKIFDFCELKYGNQTEKFIQESTSKHVENEYAVYKSKNRDDDWEKELPEYIVDEIKKDLFDNKLNKYL